MLYRANLISNFIIREYILNNILNNNLKGGVNIYGSQIFERDTD
jgi:hypothetical protein